MHGPMPYLHTSVPQFSLIVVVVPVVVLVVLVLVWVVVVVLVPVVVLVIDVVVVVEVVNASKELLDDIIKDFAQALEQI